MLRRHPIPCGSNDGRDEVLISSRPVQNLLDDHVSQLVLPTTYAADSQLFEHEFVDILDHLRSILFLDLSSTYVSLDCIRLHHLENFPSKLIHSPQVFCEVRRPVDFLKLIFFDEFLAVDSFIEHHHQYFLCPSFFSNE